MLKLSNSTSVSTGEVVGITETLKDDIIFETNRVLVMTDSMNVLQSLNY